MAIEKTENLQFEMSDGITLVADAWGDPRHPPVLFSHGGGQTRHSWGKTAEAVAAAGWYAIAYDHRGHGDSGWSPDGNYPRDRLAADQREISLGLSQPPVVVGASLGGMSAMLAEGESRETFFAGVVLVDITPRLDKDGADNVADFMRESAESGFASLEEAADVIARYTGRPRRKNLDGLHKNLRLGADQRYYWHWDPAFVDELGDYHVATSRLEAAVGNISIPMLLVRGQMSDLVTEAMAREFLALAPHADYVDVANARHMVVGDRNDIFQQAVMDFLGKLREPDNRGFSANG